MTLKSLRHSHPKNCKGAPTELLPVNPQKNVRKIKPTIKQPTATELLNQHYEELKQKKKQDKQEKIINYLHQRFNLKKHLDNFTHYAYEKS